MTSNLNYELALFHAPDFGNRAYQELLDLLQYAKLQLHEIFDQPSLFDDVIHQLKNAPYSDSLQLSHNKLYQLKQYLQQPAWDRVEKDLDWAQQAGNYLISCSDHRYPQLLKQQHSYPIVLYVKGNPLILTEIQIAIVGSRNPTPTAEETAFQFAHYLAQNGMVITSGLAMGIDASSHQGAVHAGGKTIAVAGTGINRVYPAKNKELAHKIVENGAIVSEFPLDTAPLRQNFPKRNQIISALSVGTLVVEAALKSGSLITARIAMEQGREVFAIPGSIHNPLARGCHHLIKQGAKLVESAEDIVEEISSLTLASTIMQYSGKKNTIKSSQQTDRMNQSSRTINPNLPKDQQLLLEFIDQNPISIDQLQKRCQMPIDDVNSLIVLLEIQGYIQSLPGGKVILSPHT